MGFFRRLFNSWQKKKETKAALNRIFEHTLQILNNDELQNSLMSEKVRLLLEQGGIRDEVPHPRGAFGRSLHNPIPVNGPLGEITYLSSLRTITKGERIAFYRLGSIDTIDIYEAVSFDGSHWDILYFDCYYKCKSTKLPSGYSIDTVKGITGTNSFIPGFPYNIEYFVKRCSIDIFGYPFLNPGIKKISPHTMVRNAGQVTYLRSTLRCIELEKNILSFDRNFLLYTKSGKYYDRYIARQVLIFMLRSALQYIQSHVIADEWMTPIFPPSYKKDSSCFIICIVSYILLERTLISYGRNITNDILYDLRREFCQCFSCYKGIDKFFDRITEHYRSVLPTNRDEIVKFLLEQIFDKKISREEDYELYGQVFFVYCRFIFNEIDLFMPDIHAFMKEKYLPIRKRCIDNFHSDVLNSILIRLNSELYDVINIISDIDINIDDNAVNLFVEAFPCIVLRSAQFSTEETEVWEHVYLDSRREAFRNKNCLFDSTLVSYKTCNEYLVSINKELNDTLFFLDFLDSTDMDDFLERFAPDNLEDVDEEIACRLRFIAIRAANDIAACFGLMGRLALDEEDLVAAGWSYSIFLEADELVSLRREMESLCSVRTAYDSPDWPLIESELQKDMPDDAAFDQVEGERIERKYCFRLLEGMYRLRENAGLPDSESDDDSSGLSSLLPRYDLSGYFDVYRRLSMHTGYELDYIYAKDSHGGEPFLYARPISAAPLKDSQAYCTVFNLEKLGMLLGNEPTIQITYPYLHHMKVKYDKYSMVELALFCMTARRFYLFWHSLYNDRKYILTHEYLRYLTENQHDKLTDDEYAFLKEQNISPHVVQIDNFTRIALLTYERNMGYSWLHMYFKNKYFVKMNDTVIVKNKITTLY